MRTISALYDLYSGDPVGQGKCSEMLQPLLSRETEERDLLPGWASVVWASWAAFPFPFLLFWQDWVLPSFCPAFPVHHGSCLCHREDWARCY